MRRKATGVAAITMAAAAILSMRVSKEMRGRLAVQFLRSTIAHRHPPGFTRTGTLRQRQRKIVHLLPAKVIRGALKRAGNLKGAARILDVHHQSLRVRCRKLRVKTPTMSEVAKRTWAGRARRKK